MPIHPSFLAGRVPPKIVIYPASTKATVIGHMVKFRCVVTEGHPVLNLAWYKGDGTLLIDGSRMHNITDGLVLEFKQAKKKDEGDYLCAAKNKAGFMRAIAVLTVSGEISCMIYDL